LPFYGDDGRMGGVIVAGLGLDWLADYIARKGVPEGAALAITDRNASGLSIARLGNWSTPRTNGGSANLPGVWTSGEVQ
jgi:hypothetical protein